MKKVKISQDLGQRAGKVEKGGVPGERNWQRVWRRKATGPCLGLTATLRQEHKRQKKGSHFWDALGPIRGNGGCGDHTLTHTSIWGPGDRRVDKDLPAHHEHKNPL